MIYKNKRCCECSSYKTLVCPLYKDTSISFYGDYPVCGNFKYDEKIKEKNENEYERMGRKRS